MRETPNAYEKKLIKKWLKTLKKGKKLRFKSFQERFLYALWTMK